MQSIYIETTIPSYITARDSSDVTKLFRQVNARRFWENEKRLYKCYISDFVLAECEKGNKEAAKKRTELIKGIESLPTTPEVLKVAPIYQDLLNIPDKKAVDAFHLAVAVINQIDYVLSYNFTHMGPGAQSILQRYNDAHGYKTPLLTSPDILMTIEEDEE
jgi:hypothetical protein